jgi:hypothetical protein
MKVSQHFGTLYTLLIIGQIVLCNYSQLGPYVMLSMLPAMVLCIPPSVSTITSMLIAFASGLSVDWLSEGLLGLNTAAILPVALMRKGVIKIFLGEDIISRGDRFSYRKNGFAKISAAHSVCLIIFLSLYIILDGAGTRPVWFCFAKGGASFICNFVLAIIVTNILTPDDRK